MTWHTGSERLIHKSGQLLIAERPSIRRLDVGLSGILGDVCELGVVARHHVDVLMTDSELAHRPGMSSLSGLTHHLHGLSPDLCAVVAQHRQDDAFGVRHECVPSQTSLRGLQVFATQVSSLALELFEEVAGGFNHVWPVFDGDYCGDIHGNYVQSQSGRFYAWSPCMDILTWVSIYMLLWVPGQPQCSDGHPQ